MPLERVTRVTFVTLTYFFMCKVIITRHNSKLTPKNMLTIGVLLGFVMVCNRPGARLTKAYDVTIPRYRNSHSKNENSKMHILRRMGSKFCVKFQRSPLKFHTKF